jgi:hypothetical protein
MRRDSEDNFSDYNPESDSNSEYSRVSDDTINSFTSNLTYRIKEGKNKLKAWWIENREVAREIRSECDIQKLADDNKDDSIDVNDKGFYQATKDQALEDIERTKPPLTYERDQDFSYLNSVNEWTFKKLGFHLWRKKFLEDRNLYNPQELSEAEHRTDNLNNLERDRITLLENVINIIKRDKQKALAKERRDHNKVLEELQRIREQSNNQGHSQNNPRAQGSGSLLDDFADPSTGMPDYYAGDD